MIDRLESLYAPADLGNDLTTLEQGYQDCQYVPGKDPTLFILRSQKHNTRLGKIDAKYKKDDGVIKCHMLASLPPKFRAVETKLRGTLSMITIETLSSEVQSEYKALEKHGILKNDGLVLSTKECTGKGKGIQGKCHKYGKKGHRAADCNGKKNGDTVNSTTPGEGGKGNRDKSKIKCFKCKKMGCYANECKSNKQ